MRFFKMTMLILSLMIITQNKVLAQKIYLHCGTLIDVETETVKKEQTIEIEGDKVVSISAGYKPGNEDMTVIDLKDKTVMPGWMDMHIHVESHPSKRSYEERFRLNEADVALRATVDMRKTIEAGFTTVRDLGGSGVNVSMRNAINRGDVIGPRIFTAEKSLATTGGHADPTNGFRKSLMGDPGPKEGVVNSIEDVRKAVRQRYKNGADVVKVTATGGVLSVAKDGQGPQLSEEELQAIVITAKDYGMTTAAHAHGDEGMRRAVAAGITSIEHGTKMSSETMDLMKKMGTWYVPTISAGKYVAKKADEPGYFPNIIIPKAREIGPLIQKTFEKAYARGVKIAFGTDAGVFPHGENANEFIYMVEAGMPAMEALRSATVYPAEMLNQEDLLGSLKPGKYADIIATDGNPIDDIQSVLKVDFVMKGGVVIK